MPQSQNQRGKNPKQSEPSSGKPGGERSAINRFGCGQNRYSIRPFLPANPGASRGPESDHGDRSEACLSGLLFAQAQETVSGAGFGWLLGKIRETTNPESRASCKNPRLPTHSCCVR